MPAQGLTKGGRWTRQLAKQQRQSGADNLVDGEPPSQETTRNPFPLQQSASQRTPVPGARVSPPEGLPSRNPPCLELLNTKEPPRWSRVQSYSSPPHLKDGRPWNPPPLRYLATQASPLSFTSWKACSRLEASLGRVSAEVTFSTSRACSSQHTGSYLEHCAAWAPAQRLGRARAGFTGIACFT